MKDQEPSDAEFFELLTRAVTALETIAKGFEDLNRCPRCGAVMTWCGEGDLRCFSCQEPPAALTRSEEEILRDPRPGKGVIVTEGYTPPPAEELRTICPNCHETVVRIYADPENNMLRCPECSFVWELQDAV